MTLRAATVADTTEIFFEEGVVGVPRARRFELLEQEGSPVRVLRCLDVNGFALPVVDPRLADPDYKPTISARLTKALRLEGADPLLFLAVTALEPCGSVANLRAPLLINVSKRIGLQVILDDKALPLRARVSTKT